MQTIKCIIIFLLVAVGIFATVEFINFKIEAANNWGVRMDSASSAEAALKQTASAKTSNTQKHRKIKTPALSS